MTSEVSSNNCTFCKTAIYNGSYVTADSNKYHKICAEEVFSRGLSKAKKQEYPISDNCNLCMEHHSHFYCIKDKKVFYHHPSSGKKDWLISELKSFIKGLTKVSLSDDEQFEFIRLYKLLRVDIHKDIDFLLASGHKGFWDE